MKKFTVALLLLTSTNFLLAAPGKVGGNAQINTDGVLYSELPECTKETTINDYMKDKDFTEYERLLKFTDKAMLPLHKEMNYTFTRVCLTKRPLGGLLGIAETPDRVAAIVLNVKKEDGLYYDTIYLDVKRIKTVSDKTLSRILFQEKLQTFLEKTYNSSIVAERAMRLILKYSEKKITSQNTKKLHSKLRAVEFYGLDVYRDLQLNRKELKKTTDYIKLSEGNFSISDSSGFGYNLINRKDPHDAIFRKLALSEDGTDIFEEFLRTCDQYKVMINIGSGKRMRKLQSNLFLGALVDILVRVDYKSRVISYNRDYYNAGEVDQQELKLVEIMAKYVNIFRYEINMASNISDNYLGYHHWSDVMVLVKSLERYEIVNAIIKLHDLGFVDLNNKIVVDDFDGKRFPLGEIIYTAMLLDDANIYDIIGDKAESEQIKLRSVLLNEIRNRVDTKRYRLSIWDNLVR